MDKAEPYKFTTNVPVPCEIRFVDIRPGKLWTDPKGVSKKLPSQVSIKGKFGNIYTICFLPGPAWKNVKSLAAGGVIEEGPALDAANDEQLASVVSCPVLTSRVTLTLAKPAGERYETLVVDNGAVAPQGEGRIQSPYVPPSIGRVPAMDDFPDEDYGRSVQSPSGPEDSPYDDPGPLPPFHKPQPTRGVEVAPEAAQKIARARSYLDLLAWVRTQEPTKAMADEAQQAAAATIWIDWGQKGLR